MQVFRILSKRSQVWKCWQSLHVEMYVELQGFPTAAERQKDLPALLIPVIGIYLPN
jgi:hypothetical protein